MSRFVKKLLGLAVLIVVAYAGYRWGPVVFPSLERALGLAADTAAVVPGTPQPSAELAEATLDRFEAFRAGDGEERLALGGNELTSVIRYALPGIVPHGVADPTVTLAEGRVHLTARVAVRAFPKLPRLDDIVGLLPDTVLVAMDGTLVALDQAFLSLMVDRVEVSRIPLPRRLVSEVLDGFGRQGPSSLPKDALAVPVPDGVGSVYVQGDSLVLIAKR
ncbi:MAG TPA: hypothetical protein VJ997_15095 [Longimicrobiales bacterium]|nr:hypothetical protein [Longimicrobiales bacterium]